MTATSPPLVPARRGLRAVVARHPVPAMLVMMFAVSWAVLIPPALAGIDLVPVFLLIVRSRCLTESAGFFFLVIRATRCRAA